MQMPSNDPDPVDACRLIPEHTQRGSLTLMQKSVVSSKLARSHDVWRARIEASAEAASDGLEANGR